jgi:rod shape determining protein RodA
MQPPLWRRLDPWLILLALALVGYGLVLLHSATYLPGESPRGQPSSWALRQALYAAIGFTLMFALAFLDYRWYRDLAYPLYAASLVLLGLLLVFGHGQEDYGAQRWIGVGPIAIQPSEPAKLFLILALARFFSDGGDGPPTLRRLIASLTLVGLPVGLVYMQPDLGTALSFIAIWVGVVVVAGTRVLHLVGLAALALVSLPLVWISMRGYMRERVLIFLNPESDPFGAGYNILQAKISIGSGGLLGKGLLNGTQTQLRYLRVAHSDFIFSVLAEELGLVGVLALFALLFCLALRVLRVAERARDGFGRLAATGVVAMLGFQAIINVGANLTVLPVAGIPLPFISSGGSALITNLAALGIVQSILIYRLKFRY